MDIESELAHHIVSVEYDALPQDVVEATKKSIIDTLGIAIAGSRYSVSEAVVSQIKDQGGKEESTPSALPHQSC